jgi:DNA mismatch repair protein MutL
MDIKFSKMDSLKDIIIKLIEKRLKELTLIPDAATRYLTSVNEVSKQINVEREERVEKETNYEEITLDFEVQEEEKKYNEEVIEEKGEKEEKKIRIKKMIPRGVVFLTYIVAENEDGMYLIDQHAAAERINFEKVLKEIKEDPIRIDLLVPIKIELPKNEFIVVKENFELLRKYGFDIEEFGFNNVIIRTYPNWIKEGYEEECIRALIDIVAEKEEFDLDQFIWRMAATTACRMSVMANTYISEEEQEWILDNIRYCENPFTCPHGRPTIITYSKYELERMFKRTKDSR